MYLQIACCGDSQDSPSLPCIDCPTLALPAIVKSSPQSAPGKLCRTAGEINQHQGNDYRTLDDEHRDGICDHGQASV